MNTKSLPKDIIKAARLDGLNELQIFFLMQTLTGTASFLPECGSDFRRRNGRWRR